MKSSSPSVKRIHLIAVCGTGMASLAGLLREKGCDVTGSDANVYPPMSDQLAALGIPIQLGYKAENITTAQPDLVIVGNAISKNNPEVEEVRKRGLPLLSMPEAFDRFFLSDRFPIVVAGTHGKTTTASILSWLLERTGQSPGFFVGGILKNFDRSYQLGTGDYFVIEGDEYDSAFFDKGPKFLHYRPRILILNAVEFDHADIYRDLNHVLEAFSKLIDLLPPDGLIVADGDNRNVRSLIARAKCRVLTFGVNGGCDLEAANVSLGETTCFQLVRKGERVGDFESPLAGRHNLKNLLGALGALLDLGLRPADVAVALKEFKGIKRRQEVLATIRGVTLVDDFAHHPTAVSETLAALRSKYGTRRLWAIFEPRSNTTRRNVFQEDFAAAFDAADEIIFAAPYLPEKIPEPDRLHPEDVVADLQKRGKKALYIPDVEHIVDTVAKEAAPGDVLCLMSNGGFGDIYRKMIEALKK